MDGWKRTTDDYVNAALSMAVRMDGLTGFDELYPIPVDPDGEILGGAHRTACALALGIDCYVQPMPQRAWTPAWDRQWFVDNGMSEEDLARTLADWDEMCR